MNRSFNYSAKQFMRDNVFLTLFQAPEDTAVNKAEVLDFMKLTSLGNFQRGFRQAASKVDLVSKGTFKPKTQSPPLEGRGGRIPGNRTHRTQKETLGGK